MVEIVKRGHGAKEVTCKSCDSVLRYHKGEIKERHGTDISGGSDGAEWIDCPVCAERVILRAW